MEWTLPEAVRLLVGINLVIIGVSHAVQAEAWGRFFGALAEKGTIGAFVNGLLHLGFGALIVAFHPVYAGWPVVLTVYGWLLVLKGAVCFVAPRVALRSIEIGATRATAFRWIGAVMALAGVGILIAMLTWLTG